VLQRVLCCAAEARGWCVEVPCVFPLSKMASAGSSAVPPLPSQVRSHVCSFWTRQLSCAVFGVKCWFGQAREFEWREQHGKAVWVRNTAYGAGIDQTKEDDGTAYRMSRKMKTVRRP